MLRSLEDQMLNHDIQVRLLTNLPDDALLLSFVTIQAATRKQPIPFAGRMLAVLDQENVVVIHDQALISSVSGRRVTSHPDGTDR